MSLPKDLVDQLLTGYLDDALTADERARIEQLLQSNPEIADELAQLRDLRQSLKAVAKADSSAKLDAGFADRVLGAAVARAHTEGLGDDHPLNRLAEQPSTAPATSSSSWRFAGVLVGLAASIAIAVIALRPEPRDAEGFAAVDVQPDVPNGLDPIENPAVVPDVVPEVVAQPGPAQPPMIATADPVTTPIVEDPAPQPKTTGPKTPPTDTIAKSQDPVMDAVDSPAETKAAIGTSAIFVLHVRRTELGRETDAVGKAMSQASLDATTEKKITNEIAGFVENERSSDTEVSVLYLQAPLKQLDKFYLELMDDTEGIESVGITIAADAPIMKVVSGLGADPTTVRHDASLELTSDNEVVEQLSNQLGQLPFLPMNRGTMNRGVMNAGDGPDELGQILVLVE